jgi:hypothetical protein
LAILSGGIIPDEDDRKNGSNYEAKVFLQAIRSLGELRELLCGILDSAFPVNDPLCSQRRAHISYEVRHSLLRALTIPQNSVSS